MIVIMVMKILLVERNRENYLIIRRVILVVLVLPILWQFRYFSNMWHIQAIICLVKFHGWNFLMLMLVWSCYLQHVRKLEEESWGSTEAVNMSDQDVLFWKNMWINGWRNDGKSWLPLFIYHPQDRKGYLLLFDHVHTKTIFIIPPGLQLLWF